MVINGRKLADQSVRAAFLGTHRSVWIWVAREHGVIGDPSKLDRNGKAILADRITARVLQACRNHGDNLAVLAA